MLLQVTVENFWSFRNKTTFSMLVPDESNPTSRNYVEVGGYRVLRAAALYGANASGKSNFHRVFSFCGLLIMRGSDVDEPIGVSPFLLDPASRQAPSRFEFELLIDGIRYSYGFELNRNRVLREWLFRSESLEAGEERVFERGESDEPIEYGEYLEDSEAHARLIEKSTRSNQLFLTQAAKLNLKEILPVYRWFSRSLQPIQPNAPYSRLVSRIRDDVSFREGMVTLLSGIDTGIQGLETRETVLDVDPEPGEVLEPLFLGASDEQLLSDDGKIKRLSWRTKRINSEGKLVRFQAWQESDGTKRFMHLAPVLLDHHKDAFFIVDEIDRSLHTLLTREFIDKFLDDDTNPQRQLIFTTHDTNLLTTELFPPEAIWFAEKDTAGATDLYSLAEFNPDQLEQLGPSLEAGYLAGRFGAIPFIANQDRLGWLKGE